MPKSLTGSKSGLLLVITIVGLAFRLALVSYVDSYPERYIQSDATGYDQLAKNLLAGHGYSMDTGVPYTPNNFRTPGYPISIALIYAVFGYRPSVVLWLQILMSVISILIIYYLAELIYGQKVGLIAASLLAMSPHSITYTALLWSDTEFTLFFILSMVAIVLMLKHGRFRWFFLGGLFSGFAVLIHPRTVYFPTLIGLIFIGNVFWSHKPLKTPLIRIGVFIIIFNLVLLPWRYRNYLVFGVPNLTSSAGINMLDYGAALTEASRTGENQWSIAQRYDEEVRMMSPDPLNAAEFSELAIQLGIKKILHDPITYARVHVVGMAKIFLPGTSQINTLLTGKSSLDTSQIYSILNTPGSTKDSLVNQLSNGSILVFSYISFEILYLGAIYFFSIYSIVKQGRVIPWIWIIVITILYLAAVVGPAGSPRFRVVMMPLLCILAAFGVMSMHHSSQKLESLQISIPT